MKISIYNLKQKFQGILMPLCEKLNSFGITPNQITIFTALLSICFSFIFYIYGGNKILLLLVSVFFLVRMALNALDGMIANIYNKKTSLGVYLNETGDVVADTVFFICFFAAIQTNFILSISFIFLAILSEYVGVVAVQVDKKRHYEGPMGKSDRAFFIGVISLLLFFNTPLIRPLQI